MWQSLHDLTEKGNLFLFCSWTVKAKRLLVPGDRGCLCGLPHPSKD